MNSGITRPTLLIREEICRDNIRRMAEKARQSALVFRPHFKTHQSLEVAAWFRDYGVDKITVSSAEMAGQFAGAGWDEITIAFPVNAREIKIYNELAAMADLNLLADSIEGIEFLSKKMEHAVGLFIEIDCGYGRSGVASGNTEYIESMLESCNKAEKIHFKGFLTHSGNTYHAKTTEEICIIYEDNISKLKALKQTFLPAFPETIISIGDTPSCSLIKDLSDADEIRPGNFVYYDLMQYELGVCTFEDIAVSVACPVAGIYPERNEILIYGGAVHLSKEHLKKDGNRYGLVVQYNDRGWSRPVPDAELITISQEHGIIRTQEKFIKTIKHGDLLGIIPVHSCLTANLLKDQVKII